MAKTNCPTCGKRMLTHGLSGHKSGCRCDVCLNAVREAARRYRAANKGVKRGVVQVWYDTLMDEMITLPARSYTNLFRQRFVCLGEL